MFDFEKLVVYSKVKMYNQEISFFLKQNSIQRATKEQLHRASLSMMLNIAEGSGRFTNRDKRNFYVIARGSAFECVAILDYLKDSKKIEEDSFKCYYDSLEEISRMLYGMIKSLSE